MNKKILKVGITGGIGSGKSTISRIFSLLDIPVYIADDEAKRIMHENEKVRHAIIDLFGKDIYGTDGQLQRAKLAEKVFQNRELLEKLNAIVHPAVQEDMLEWFQRQDSPYAIEEAAILIESGAYKFMDYIIVVEAPKKLILKRVMARDKVSRKDVEARINNQMTAAERRKYADFVIKNNERQFLVPQVLKIDKILREKALLLSKA